MTLAQAQSVITQAPSRGGDEERTLLRRARQDRSAFGELYRRHVSAIGRYIYRRTGDRHATDDLVSEVFLAAFTSIGRYRDRGKPVRHWLLRIATNAVNRWARRRRRLLAREPLLADPIAADNDEPAEETRDLVQQALLCLSERHQAVLSLHYLEGLPVRDVAGILGVREGTIKSRLSRAREALREELRKRRYRHGYED
ncbi:MAG: RNA polymerase sigma factor [Phycisphaerales bacterium JB038]